jgi:hypothetical protein
MISAGWEASKARVWLGSFPDWPSERADVLEQRLPAYNGLIAEERQAAVENYPPGPMNRYGALGATFTPGDTGALMIGIVSALRTGPRVADALAGRVDEVRQGLLTEYAQAVLDAAQASVASTALGSGTLEFSRAMHEEVGSSQSDFGIFATM